MSLLLSVGHAFLGCDVYLVTPDWQPVRPLQDFYPSTLSHLMAATLMSDMLIPQDEDAGPGPSAEGKSAGAIADTNGVPVSAEIDDKDMQKSTAGLLLGEHCLLAMDVSCW